MKKIALVLGLVAVFAFVNVASAATLAEQIAALQAQLATLMAQAGGTATAASSVPTITKSLTIGSKGDEVEALQKYLEDEGLLEMPAGVDYGYFGPLTKKAVIAWQKANEVSPASGYFGPISRAALAALAETTTTTTTTTTTGITTKGAEGTLTVTTNPNPGAGQTVRSGDSKVGVLGLKLEAKSSDIAVQRVKVDLGTSSVIYNKLFKTIYLMDGSTVVAQSDLNSSTVVKDGSTYYITLSGFNVIVAKDGTKVLTLAVDAYNTIDSAYNGVTTYGLLVPIDGVRGVDGAGLTETGPASTVPTSRRTVTLQGSALSDSATMTVSKNTANSPVAATIVASDGTANNEKDGVTFLVFDLKAKKDALKVTDLNASIQKTGTGAATATTAYLYDGSSVVGSATVDTSNGMVVFSDIDVSVPADGTKTLTLKADIRNADGTAAVLTASTTAANITVENSLGTAIVPTGSATGEAQTIVKAGPEISLVSTPTITSNDTVRNDTGTLATTTITGTFVVRVKAVGADVLLGAQASVTPMFASSTSYFKLYNGNTATAAVPTVSFTLPSDILSGTTATIAEGDSRDITVTASFTNRNAAGSALTTTGLTYGVGMEKVQYNGSDSSTFMSGKSTWTTNAVTMPLI